MALQLSIASIVQSNDCTTLTVTDGAGLYDVSTNPTGWGTPNTELSDINGTMTDLTLQITVTTSDGTETIYDAIDFYDLNLTTPTTIDDLVFEINASHLESGGVAMGTADDPLDDGWYVFTYTVSKDLATGGGTSYTYTTYKLIVGSIKKDIYEYFLTIPFHNLLAIPNRIYTNNEQTLIYPIYLASLYEGMIGNITESRKNEILNHLYLLEELCL